MSETQQLRTRIDELVAQLGADYPEQMIVRALIAKACNISLSDLGLLATMHVMEKAVSLLAGHWAPDRVQLFIDSPNY